MCAYNVFLKILYFWVYYECLTILRRVSYFTACSVDVGDFLPHTVLSSRRRFFTAYSIAVGDFLPHTQ